MAAKPALAALFVRARPTALVCALLGALLCGALLAARSDAQLIAPGADTGTTAPTAEEQAEALQQSTPAERAELLSRLSDEQVRSLLLDYLAAGQAAASDGSQSAIDDFDRSVQLFREGIEAQLAEAYILPTLPGFLYVKLSEGRGPYNPLIVLVALIATGLAAYGIERGYRHLARRHYDALAVDLGSSSLQRLGRLSVRLGLDLVGLAIFTASILAIFFITYQGHEPSRLFVMTLLSATVGVRTTAVISRFLFAPYASHLRIAPFDDAVALRVHRWILAAATITMFGLGLCLLMLRLGLPFVQHELAANMVGILLVAILIAAALGLRRPVGTALQELVVGDTAWSRLLRALASVWHVGFIAYVLLIFLLSVFSSIVEQGTAGSPGLTSLLILLAVPLADFILRAFLPARFGGDAEDAARNPASAIPVFKRAARFLLIIFAIYLVGRVWGVNFFELGQQGVGEEFMRAIIDIALIVLVAYVLWGVIKASVARYLPSAPEGDEEVALGDEGGAGASRVETILPLIMRFVQITLVVIVTLILLSSLGVEIGPLLAGAGVIGLAVGFGAQTLVRDIVSGFFFLMDDAFRRGEYVNIGAVMGTVERINVRSLVLRHHLGALHTVPFGEIQHLTNYSRDWVILKMEFRVPTDTDVNKVKKLFKVIGAEMLEHPTLGKDFLQPFKSQGVKSIEDSAMIIRGKFMCRPGTQFMIRKELFNRVQQAFHENGIHFAHRKVTVELPEDLQLTEEQKQKVAQAAGAAALASEEQQPQPATAPEAGPG